MKFFDELQQQRWDDHRYYHQSRINQSLHFLSAVTFLSTYILIFINPVLATFLGWFIAMLIRQVGHFFFEPKDFDEVNHATQEYKESIKVGYNLKRKVILLSIWALSPVALYYYPTMLGFFLPHTDLTGYLNNLGKIWLALAIAALIFRTIQLFFIQNVQAGLVWFTKIMTDPFHDIMIYHKSPVYLLKGQLLDPMVHIK